MPVPSDTQSSVASCFQLVKGASRSSTSPRSPVSTSHWPRSTLMPARTSASTPSQDRTASVSRSTPLSADEERATTSSGSPRPTAHSAALTA